MGIVDQIEKLMKDMERLVSDLNCADIENIDKSQLLKLRNYSRGFACDIDEQIHRVIENE